MSNLYNNHFQNFKVYQIPKAQLIIADIPYNLGNNAYASNPAWYKDGDNKNGESELAGKEFFDTDKNFRPAEFMHFCSTMLKKEPAIPKSDDGKRQKSQSPCMIVFCEFEQQFYLIELAKRYGLNKYINLVFRKNFSAQVLKANMKVVGNCEYGLLLYRDRLPKFNNNGKMIFNCIDWERDEDSEKLHPTQKPVKLLKKLIEIFTDPGDVVIDPCAGSGSTLVAAIELDRKAYGFEIKKDFYKLAKQWVDETVQRKQDIKQFGFNKTETEKTMPTLF
jgi:site-specific DNA-methyltransferase (adenine-specific)